MPPWKVLTCACHPINDCEKCDGAGWYYHNPVTGKDISDQKCEEKYGMGERE